MKWIRDGKRLLGKDPAFHAILKKFPDVPLQPIKRVDLFTALTHAIISQQISGYAADAIYGRLAALFPGRRLRARTLLRFRTTTLRRVGLSGNKARFLKDLAAHVVQRKLPSPRQLHLLPDHEIMERLTDVLGIGPWTVQMLLIFKLGRSDIFPSADIGVQRGFQNLYRKTHRPTVKQLDRFSLRWKPYRTLAAWYLWRASDDVAFNPVVGDQLWTKLG